MGDDQADTDAAGDAMGLKGYKLGRVTVKLGVAVSCDACAIFVLALLGSNTPYKGALYIDNVDGGLGESERT